MQARTTSHGAGEELEFLKEETVSIATRHEAADFASAFQRICDYRRRLRSPFRCHRHFRPFSGAYQAWMSCRSQGRLQREHTRATTNSSPTNSSSWSTVDRCTSTGRVWCSQNRSGRGRKSNIRSPQGPASVVCKFNAFDRVIIIIQIGPGDERDNTPIRWRQTRHNFSAAVHAGSARKLDYRLSIGRDQVSNGETRTRWRSGRISLMSRLQYNFSGDVTLRVAGGFIDTNRFDGPVSNADSPIPVQPGLYGRSLSIPEFLASWLVAGQRYSRRRHSSAALPVRQTDQCHRRPRMSPSPHRHIISKHSTVSKLKLVQSRLSYGINYRYNVVDGAAVSELGREDRLGFHLQDEWKLLSPLTLVGIRYDLHTPHQWYLEPASIWIYSLTPEHTFRISGSVAYRPPTLFRVES